VDKETMSASSHDIRGYFFETSFWPQRANEREVVVVVSLCGCVSGGAGNRLVQGTGKTIDGGERLVHDETRKQKERPEHQDYGLEASLAGRSIH
jgi:hypothetical protein